MAQVSLHKCTYSPEPTQSKDTDKDSDQNLGHKTHWTFQNEHLKEVF